MISRWQGAPQPVPTIVLALVIVLAYGSVVHAVQLMVSGFNPYQGMPGWLRTYFVALTVLDPLAAWLLARCHRSGVALTVAVLVSNAAANGFANYALDADGVTGGRIGHAAITMLAVGACAAAPRLWRLARDTTDQSVSGRTEVNGVSQ